jgi:hypothetical protein
MVAKELRAAGLHLGADADFVQPAPDNPGGFFEHEEFVRLDEDLLAATGGAWDHLPACPPMAADDPRVAGLRERASQLVARLADARAWGWKDPRVSLTARFWLDLLPELRVVVCLRHPLEVALSLKQRNNTSYAHALSLWHGYYEALLDAVPAERRIVTSYDAHFRDAGAEIPRIIAFARLPQSDVAGAEAASEPRLRHHRLDLSLAAAGVDPETVALYERLRDEAGDPISAAERTARPGAHAAVDRNALDLRIARERLERRSRQVTSLERQREELKARVAELESLGRGDALGEIKVRIERLEHAIRHLEDGVQDVRYELQDLSGRADAHSLRACRRLVRASVPPSATVLVIAKADPLWLDLHGRPTANFPQDASGRYPGFTFSDGIAAIAHLEAHRMRGAGFLLIPRMASWWTESFPDFAAHLAGCYRVIADQEDAGMLVDLRSRRSARDGAVRSLPAVIDRLAAAYGREPSVLDCTGRELGAQLPDRNVFTPPASGALPYVDGTVDVVLVSEGSPSGGGANGQLAEARRVAGLAVVTVEEDAGAVVAEVDHVAPPAEEPDDGRIRIVVGATEPEPRWLEHLEEAVAAESNAEVVVGAQQWGEVAAGAEVVGIVEEGVLPLPGCLDAVRSTLRDEDLAGAVAPTLLGADGSMEAAGTIVFADGSWAGIAAGSHQVAAPWHEYVRGTCGAAGALFLAAASLEELDAAGSRPQSGTPTSWAGTLWAAGLRVLYQPDAAAVRAADPPETSRLREGSVAEAWAPALQSRPTRPEVLDEGAWRSLLTRENVAAAWAAPRSR